MSAQWIFLDVKSTAVTGWTICFRSQLFYRKKYHQDIYVLLRRIAATERLTDRLPDIHRLLCILLEVAMPMKSVPEDVIRLRNYIENHFSHPISTADLANILHCSRAGVFRAFRQSFETPRSIHHKCSHPARPTASAEHGHDCCTDRFRRRHSRCGILFQAVSSPVRLYCRLLAGKIERAGMTIVTLRSVPSKFVKKG